MDTKDIVENEMEDNNMENKATTPIEIFAEHGILHRAVKPMGTSLASFQAR